MVCKPTNSATTTNYQTVTVKKRVRGSRRKTRKKAQQIHANHSVYSTRRAPRALQSAYAYYTYLIWSIHDDDRMLPRETRESRSEIKTNAVYLFRSPLTDVPLVFATHTRMLFHAQHAHLTRFNRRARTQQPRQSHDARVQTHRYTWMGIWVAIRCARESDHIIHRVEIVSKC